MTNARIAFLLALVGGVPFSALAQTVISTHSGVVYFFEGTVYVGTERLEQNFGKFPEVSEGRQLWTEHGRAEVLLTPGVLLRVGENTAIRMLSNKLSDTRVELLDGSAIVDSSGGANNTAVTLIYKHWNTRVPQRGICRMESDPAQLEVYKGEVEVSAAGKPESVPVREGEVLPFAAVLVTEKARSAGRDAFQEWAMSRSRAISQDNMTAAGMADDPGGADTSDAASRTSSHSAALDALKSWGTGVPYGLSFLTPSKSLSDPLLDPYSVSPYSNYISPYSPYSNSLSPYSNYASPYLNMNSLSPYLNQSLYWGWPGGISSFPGGFPSRIGGGIYPGAGRITSPGIRPLPVPPLPHAPAAPPITMPTHPGGTGGVHSGAHR